MLLDGYIPSFSPAASLLAEHHALPKQLQKNHMTTDPHTIDPELTDTSWHARVACAKFRHASRIKYGVAQRARRTTPTET